MHELHPFRHQAEACAEAAAISSDENAPFAMRLASICLLAHLDGRAAVPLIEAALADSDLLNESREDFASNVDWITTAAERIPHPSFVPGLQQIRKTQVWYDTLERRKLISRCRRAKSE
jgi:hypothetical protein